MLASHPRAAPTCKPTAREGRTRLPLVPVRGNPDDVEGHPGRPVGSTPSPHCVMSQWFRENHRVRGSPLSPSVSEQ